MSKKQLLIVAMIVTVSLLMAVAPQRALVFLCVVTFWGVVLGGSGAARRWWKEREFLQKALYVSDICRVAYFRRVPKEQLETWVFLALTAHEYVLLGDPILGRSVELGYAWQNGKKAVVVIQQGRALIDDDLRRTYTLKNKLRVENAIIISPFSKAPRSNLPGLEILAGDDLLRWMSVLNGVRPVNLRSVPIHFCSCGAQQVEQVSRAGEPLLVCSRFPDCQKAECPVVVKGPLVPRLPGTIQVAGSR